MYRHWHSVSIQNHPSYPATGLSIAHITSRGRTSKRIPKDGSSLSLNLSRTSNTSPLELPRSIAFRTLSLKLGLENHRLDSQEKFRVTEK